MEILFNCSEKLASKLSDLSNKENCDISDLIEEALFSHFKINLNDISDRNLDDIDMIDIYEKFGNIQNLDNYVYIYLDPRYPGDYHFGKYHFICKPFYVGKGNGDRINIHLNSSHNESVSNMINSIREQGLLPIIERIHDKVSSIEAYRLENNLIYLIKEQIPSLCNKSGGIKFNDIENILSPNNIEINRNTLILKILNNSDSISESASKLKLSERTLYRKIKSLDIKKVNGTYII